MFISSLFFNTFNVQQKAEGGHSLTKLSRKGGCASDAALFGDVKPTPEKRMPRRHSSSSYYS